MAILFGYSAQESTFHRIYLPCLFFALSSLLCTSFVLRMFEFARRLILLFLFVIHSNVSGELVSALAPFQPCDVCLHFDNSANALESILPGTVNQRFEYML